MKVESETLLPEPTISVWFSGSNETALMELKEAEEILLDITLTAEAPGSSYILPISSSSDLFGRDLGDYEFNEIRSFFNLDTQQMSADLETLGFSASGAGGGGDDGDGEPPLVATSNDQVTGTEASSERKPPKAQKRKAAEISEDEGSQSSKAKRVTRSSSTPETVPSAAVPISPLPTDDDTKKPLAAAAATGCDPSRQVDTSTAHVKALTGTKGAAMSFEIVSGTEMDTTVAVPNVASADWSAEERAKFSRDRNRLHARNTRIRKKAYVDELKRTLEELVRERDGAAALKTRLGQLEREERNVRYGVLEEFLRLRGSNKPARARWNAIMEETIALRLPKLDFTSAEGEGNLKRTVTGVSEIMKECGEFYTKHFPTGYFNFQCDRSSLLMEGSNVVLDWTATPTDPAKVNLVMLGTCRATFNPQSNKLQAVELFFDTSSLKVVRDPLIE